MITVQKDWFEQTEIECFISAVHYPGNSLKGILPLIDESLDGQIGELIKSGDIPSNKKSVTVIHTLGKIKTKRIIFVGLGREKEVTDEIWKESFAKGLRKARELGAKTVSIDFDSFGTDSISAEKAAQYTGETYMLSLYEFNGYKQRNTKPDKQIERLVFYTKQPFDQLKAAVDKGFIYGKGTNYARTLVNLPPNILTANTLAEYAANTAEKYGFGLEVLKKDEMLELGMGALLAVNQGSAEEPAMIVLTYQGKPEWNDVLALVGKGVTYDTGGYSLKPRDGLIGMKSDMGGAAAVLGAMEIIGERKPKQNVVAVIAATDNMVSASAFKPDDVITSLSGLTIEVLNTDAEGRLALADAVTYAKHHGADYIIDAATLTGGIVVALGREMTGAFTNDRFLYEQVERAAYLSGEPIWQLPITEKDRDRVRGSKIADLNNSPGRDGHAIMGAAFVGEFAGETPWVHLDIAGTATTKAPNNLQAAGGTGVMARTLAELVEDFRAKQR